MKKIRRRIMIACAACDVNEIRITTSAINGLESKVNLLERKLDDVLNTLSSKTNSIQKTSLLPHSMLYDLSLSQYAGAWQLDYRDARYGVYRCKTSAADRACA
jgi:hypothetical protein